MATPDCTFKFADLLCFPRMGNTLVFGACPRVLAWVGRSGYKNNNQPIPQLPSRVAQARLALQPTRDHGPSEDAGWVRLNPRSCTLSKLVLPSPWRTSSVQLCYGHPPASVEADLRSLACTPDTGNCRTSSYSPQATCAPQKKPQPYSRRDCQTPAPPQLTCRVDPPCYPVHPWHSSFPGPDQDPLPSVAPNTVTQV